MADVAILIPTRGRLDRLERVVANAQHPDANVYLIMEPDEAISLRGASTMTRYEGFGKYAIAANYGYRATEEPFLFTAADDLNFHSGWLETARSRLSDKIMVVGTNDLGLPQTLAGETSTHHLIDRRYVDVWGGVVDQEPGTMFCELYDHNYHDTEFVETAKRRERWAPCLEAVVEHMHPLWGKASDDEGYQRTRANVSADAQLYYQRREMAA